MTNLILLEYIQLNYKNKFAYLEFYKFLFVTTIMKLVPSLLIVPKNDFLDNII